MTEIEPGFGSSGESGKAGPLHRRFETAAGWASRNPTVAISVAGVALYVVLRWSAIRFYAPLGFTPEEVGLGYVETLTWMLYGLLAIVGIRVVVKLVVPRLAAVLDVALRKVRRKPGISLEETWLEYVRRSGGLRRLLEPSDVAWTLIVVLSTPLTLASFLAPHAVLGEPVAYAPLSPIWRAEAARIHTLKEDSALPVAGKCVLFLGEADGIYAIYDPETRQSWAVPAAEVAIEKGDTFDDVERVPDDCPE